MKNWFTKVNRVAASTMLAALLLLSAVMLVGCSELDVLDVPMGKLQEHAAAGEPGLLAVSAQPSHVWDQRERFLIFVNEKGEYSIHPFIDGSSSMGTIVLDAAAQGGAMVGGLF